MREHVGQNPNLFVWFLRTPSAQVQSTFLVYLSKPPSLYPPIYPDTLISISPNSGAFQPVTSTSHSPLNSHLDPGLNIQIKPHHPLGNVLTPL